MLTLLETSFTVLWMPLAQGTVVRFVDCTFHKPTIVTVVYTLVSILPCTCERVTMHRYCPSSSGGRSTVYLHPTQ